MSRTRFQRLEDIFQRAVPMAGDERRAFVAEACRGDADLEQEVLRMLEVSAGGELTLHAAVADGAGAVINGADSWLGRTVGSYRLESLLGTGGMGAVYLARRVDDFELKVAIKFIRDLPGGQWEARFRRERQLLASLKHPNIAQVLDGGEDEAGRSFVVMEYVDGLTIDEYCRQHHLSVAARLDLFVKLCAGVQYAHASLVVHRDIKPANVLVDPHGEPKLLDFGIAKLLPAEGEADHATMTVALALTPQYASPEQIRGESVSVASDIYSLGVLLYELLCGTPAQPVESTRPSDIERAICDTTPPPPSRNVSEALDRRERDHRARRLRGDLDRIVMMAMRKEPNRRYGSAAQLAEDLIRYRTRLPVRACPDTAAYRLRKFVARHPAAVGIGSLFALSVAAFGAVMAWQANALARERDRARVEAEAARQATEFMIELFQVSDPLETVDRELTARDLLDAGAERIDEELAGDPVTRARLLHVMGLAYSNLGEIERGTGLVQRGLEIRRAELGPDSLEVADSLNRLGNIHRRNGDLRRAEPMLGEALEIRERRMSVDDPDLADSYNNYGLMLYELGRYGAAGDTLDKAIAMHNRLAGEDNSAAAVSMHNLALVRRQQARYAEAVALAEEALRIKKATGREAFPTYGNTLGMQAETQRRMGKLDAALITARRSLEARLSTYPGDHFRVGTARATLGAVARELGRYDEAREHLQRALEIDIAAYGEDALAVAGIRQDLGLLELYAGDTAAAVRELGQALDIRERRMDPDNPRLWTSELSLGAALLLDGRTERAGSLIESVAARRTERLGEGHPDTLLASAVLAEYRRRSGDPAAARVIARRVLANRSEALAARQSRAVACLTLAEMAEEASERERLGSCAGAEITALAGPEHPLLARLMLGP